MSETEDECNVRAGPWLARRLVKMTHLVHHPPRTPTQKADCPDKSPPRNTISRRSTPTTHRTTNCNADSLRVALSLERATRRATCVLRWVTCTVRGRHFTGYLGRDSRPQCQTGSVARGRLPGVRRGLGYLSGLARRRRRRACTIFVSSLLFLLQLGRYLPRA